MNKQQKIRLIICKIKIVLNYNKNRYKFKTLVILSNKFKMIKILIKINIV